MNDRPGNVSMPGAITRRRALQYGLAGAVGAAAPS